MVLHTLPKILLVDNRPENLDMLTQLLSDIEVEVITAQRGKEALELALQHNIGLILMDARLPELDGLDTARFLRASQEIPIIFITAHGSEYINFLKGYEGSAIDFLVRPIDPNILKNKVDIFLALHHQKTLVEFKNKQLNREIELRKEIEIELLQAKVELDKKVKTRTAQLSAALEELRQSEDKIRLVINSIPMMVAFINQDFVYEYANQPYIDFIKQDDHLVGKQVKVALPSEFYAKCLPYMKQALRGIISVFETTIAIPSMPDKIVRIEYIPYAVEEVSRGFFGVIQDITRQKDEIAKMTRINSQNRQIRKLKALATLSGGVAHEFSNLLVPVIGFSKMIQKTLAEDSPEFGYMNRVIDGANRAKEIVNQIRVFSSKREIQYKPLSLNPTIDRILEQLKQVIPENIQITVQVKDPPHDIMGSYSQIHQLFQNLIENAMDALPEGGEITITISNQIESSGHEFINQTERPVFTILEFKDTGHGMSVETKEQMFDPFFTTKEKGKHIGLGLSVVLGIVEQMDGTIHVDSQPESGTCITLKIPSILQIAQQNHQRHSQDTSGKPKNILIIDDEPAVLEASKQLLEDNGYLVTTENNCVSGLKRFSQHPYNYNLVIVDYYLPDMLGVDLISAMKEIRDDLPYVICSAYIDNTKEGKIKASGIDVVLKKPFTTKDVDALLNQES